MYQLMKDAAKNLIQRICVRVSGYYTKTDGGMSMPYNSSTPVLWVNKDVMKKALDPEMDLSTQVETHLTLQRQKVLICLLYLAAQLGPPENFSAYHNIPFATVATDLVV